MILHVILRTTAFERAEQLGWSIRELSRRSGVAVETLYKLRSGERQPAWTTIEGLLRAFPNLSYRDLFVSVDRTDRHEKSIVRQEENQEAASA
jgi:transcriptional regulator with XRE-family HTH domain